MDAQNSGTDRELMLVRGWRIAGSYKIREGTFPSKSGTVILKTVKGSIFERHCRIIIRDMGFEIWIKAGFVTY